MIYLSGVVRKELLFRHDVGIMLTPRMGNRVDLTGTPWAADTGCFTRPHDYSHQSYLDWLDRDREFHGTCLFATAPDVVGDAAATLRRSQFVLPLLRKRVPAALIAQDGLESLSIPWDTFDCLFIGGTTEFKLSRAALILTREAQKRRKWTHMGRVNSRKRFVYAAQEGYDSVDGTHLAFEPTAALAQLESWLRIQREQKGLWSLEG